MLETIDYTIVKRRAGYYRLKLGRGSTQQVIDKVMPFIGTPCKYCKEIITEKNFSLDHKDPLPSSKRGLANLSPKEIERLSSMDNIQVIDLICNRSKNNLTDEQYTSLLEFLEKDPVMKAIVLKKMKMSNFIFRKK